MLMNLKKKTNFNLRSYNKDDYDTLVEWWKILDWDPIPKEFLNNGLIIDGYCAGFLNIDNKMSYMFPLISNKNSNVMQRDRALDLLIKGIKKQAIKKGCSFVFTTSSNNSLIKRLLKRHNMLIAEDKITSLICPLDNYDEKTYDIMIEDKYINNYSNS